MRAKLSHSSTNRLGNRMWSDRTPVKRLDNAKKDYVPSHLREGFDESKVIRLKPGE